MPRQPNEHAAALDAGLDLSRQPVAAVSAIAAGAPAASPAAPLAREESRPPATPRAFSRWMRLKSFSISAVAHAVLLVALGLIFDPAGGAVGGPAVIARMEPSIEAPVEAMLPERALEVASRLDSLAMTTAIESPLVVDISSSTSQHADSAAPAMTTAEALTDDAFDAAELTQRLSMLVEADLLAGRGASSRARLLATGGGTAASEEAVDRGLRWLQAHQMSDGSWRFNHRISACDGRCANPGSHASTTAATALALMAFLGAGQTHERGDYKENVRDGLYYLAGRMKRSPHGGDFQEGTMYAQGMAAIALCEALAMTRDESLREPAGEAIRFILFAQDSKGGGWRYTPGEPGDVTVTGWQLMALKSAQMSYLNVPPAVIGRVDRFLDGKSENYGAFYGYLTPGKQPSTTAIGLLCRMYTGWTRENAALSKGVRYLSEIGPSDSDMYYNYYATLVLHHWGGYEWKRWNERMRDYLVAKQAVTGHEAGSWYFDDDHQSGAQGGRLYNTALAIMMLEVYYRYMPLYDLNVLAD